MGPDQVIEIGEQALKIATLIATPSLATALGIGLLIGTFQAATQINEATLSFIPKLGALVVAIFIAGPWMLHTLVSYTRELFLAIPTLVG
ncbi:MAG: flagellar biosynthesis protein FliQ [Pseudomonadota bacterium]